MKTTLYYPIGGMSNVTFFLIAYPTVTGVSGNFGFMAVPVEYLTNPVSAHVTWLVALDLPTAGVLPGTTDFRSQILYLSASWTALTRRRKLSRLSQFHLFDLILKLKFLALVLLSTFFLNIQYTNNVIN